MPEQQNIEYKSSWRDEYIKWICAFANAQDGKLPEDLNLKQLKGKHPSRPRNKNIAEIFFRAGFIEVWGRGIAKINSALNKAGLRKSEIKEFAGGLQITFSNRNVKALENDTENVPENVPENKTENDPENRIQKILNEINNDKFVSIPLLSARLNINIKTLKRDIKKLQEDKKIKRIGPDKGGYWEIL